MKKVLFVLMAVMAMMGCEDDFQTFVPEMRAPVLINTGTVEVSSTGFAWYLGATAYSVEVAYHGESQVKEKGVCWGLNHNPTIDDEKSMATPTGRCEVVGLMVGQTYYVRAYAINGVGVGYSEEVPIRIDAQ